MTEQRLLRLPQADSTGLVDLSSWEDTRSDAINIPDFEGLLRAIPEGVPVLEGARFPTNRALHSSANLGNTKAPDNLSVGDLGAYTATADYTSIDLSADASARVYYSTYSAFFPAGSDVVLSFEAQADSGSGTIPIRLLQTTDSVGLPSIDSTSWTRVSVTLLDLDASSVVVYFGDRREGGTITQYKIRNIQLENVTGQANKNPSEYIYGESAVDGTYFSYAYYLTENGNTVASNVVTEAVGSAITGYYWAHYPAATNSVTYSHEFDNAAWTKSKSSVTANDAVGVDGTYRADLISDDNSTGTGYVYVQHILTVPTADSEYVFSVYAKASGVDHIVIYAQVFGATQNAGQYFDLTTGTVGVVFGSAPNSAGIEAVGDDGWYRCWIADTTADADVTGQFRIYISETNGGAASVPLDGTSSVHIQGAQTELGSIPGPPINTSGASVNRSTCLMRYPFSESVFNQAAGTAILIITLGYDSTDVPSNADGVLGLRNSSVYSFLYTANANGRINTYDGSNSKLVEPTWTAGDTITIGVHWTDGGDYGVSAKINADAWGTWDEGAYDGTFTAEDWISLFLGNDFNNQAHNVDIFDTDKGTDWVESYDPDTWVYTPPVTTGGGVGKRGKPKKKFAVIDGKMIQVASYQEAQELFKHLKKTKEVPKKRTIKLKASGTYVSVFDNPNTPMPLRTVREILNKKEEAEEEEMLLLFLM